MLIYIRHSDDECPSATYRHDTKITDQGANAVMKFTQRLIEKYELPTVIYCSPFRRCKYTVKYMMKILRKNYNHIPQIRIDSRLSRFFSPKEKLNPDIGYKTAKHIIPINETYDEFKIRTGEFIKDIHLNTNKTTNVWIITHTLVLKQVCKKYRKTFPHRIPFLYTIPINLKQ